MTKEEKFDVALPDKAEDLGYLSLPEDFRASLRRPETFGEKFTRKTKENPLVPLGMVLTVGVLIGGLGTLRSGNTKKSQRMMRYRVAAQGFTFAALLGGVGYDAYKKRKARELAAAPKE